MMKFRLAQLLLAGVCCLHPQYSSACGGFGTQTVTFGNNFKDLGQVKIFSNGAQVEIDGVLYQFDRFADWRKPPYSLFSMKTMEEAAAYRSFGAWCEVAGAAAASIREVKSCDPDSSGATVWYPRDLRPWEFDPETKKMVPSKTSNSIQTPSTIKYIYKHGVPKYAIEFQGNNLQVFPVDQTGQPVGKKAFSLDMGRIPEGKNVISAWFTTNRGESNIKYGKKLVLGPAWEIEAKFDTHGELDAVTGPYLARGAGNEEAGVVDLSKAPADPREAVKRIGCSAQNALRAKKLEGSGSPGAEQAD